MGWRHRARLTTISSMTDNTTQDASGRSHWARQGISLRRRPDVIGSCKGRNVGATVAVRKYVMPVAPDDVVRTLLKTVTGMYLTRDGHTIITAPISAIFGLKVAEALLRQFVERMNNDRMDRKALLADRGECGIRRSSCAISLADWVPRSLSRPDPRTSWRNDEGIARVPPAIRHHRCAGYR